MTGSTRLQRAAGAAIHVGLAALVLVALQTAALAQGSADGLLSQFSVGASYLYFGVDRVYHATTECHEQNCSIPRLRSPDLVEVSPRSSSAIQLELEFHAFGTKHTADPLLTPSSIFLSLVTSYGFQADNKQLIDGFGLGYTLAVFDLGARRDAVNIGLGFAWLNDVHVLQRDVANGRPIPAALHAPTAQKSLLAPMLTVSINL